jgi:hypothetical protein
MISEFIAQIVTCFSMPIVYIFLAWFLIVGFLGRAALVVIATKNNTKNMMLAIATLHLYSLALAYLLAPIMLAGLITILQQLFHVAMDSLISNSFLMYLWLSCITIQSFRLFLCFDFVAVSCAWWRKYVLTVDGITVLVGYLVMHVLKLC